MADSKSKNSPLKRIRSIMSFKQDYFKPNAIVGLLKVVLLASVFTVIGYYAGYSAQNPTKNKVENVSGITINSNLESEEPPGNQNERKMREMIILEYLTYVNPKNSKEFSSAVGPSGISILADLLPVILTDFLPKDNHSQVSTPQAKKAARILEGSKWTPSSVSEKVHFSIANNDNWPDVFEAGSPDEVIPVVLSFLNHILRYRVDNTTEGSPYIGPKQFPLSEKPKVSIKAIPYLEKIIESTDNALIKSMAYASLQDLKWSPRTTTEEIEMLFFNKDMDGLLGMSKDEVASVLVPLMMNDTFAKSVLNKLNWEPSNETERIYFYFDDILAWEDSPEDDFDPNVLLPLLIDFIENEKSFHSDIEKALNAFSLIAQDELSLQKFLQWNELFDIKRLIDNIIRDRQYYKMERDVRYTLMSLAAENKSFAFIRDLFLKGNESVKDLLAEAIHNEAKYNTTLLQNIAADKEIVQMFVNVLQDESKAFYQQIYYFITLSNILLDINNIDSELFSEAVNAQVNYIIENPKTSSHIYFKELFFSQLTSETFENLVITLAPSNRGIFSVLYRTMEEPKHLSEWLDLSHAHKNGEPFVSTKRIFSQPDVRLDLQFLESISPEKIRDIYWILIVHPGYNPFNDVSVQYSHEVIESRRIALISTSTTIKMLTYKEFGVGDFFPRYRVTWGEKRLWSVPINQETILWTKYDVERLKVLQNSAIDYYREAAQSILKEIGKGKIKVVEDQNKVGLGKWDEIELTPMPNGVIK